MPSRKLLPVFSSCGHSISSTLSAKEVREAVTSYVKANKLVSTDNPKLVQFCHDKPVVDANLSKYLL